MEKPTLKQRLDGFGKFIWNSEEGKVLGRGARSWGEIGIFYLIYYICLAGFFVATIAVFYQTLEDDVPALLGSSSLLKGNPGVGFRPRPSKGSEFVRSSTIQKEYKKYFDDTVEALTPYQKTYNSADCSSITEPRPNEKLPCAHDFANLTTDCNEANAFGMKEGAPCILLRLNKVFGWSPRMWPTSDLANSGIPANAQSAYSSDHVFVNCKGRKSKDEKKLETATIDYFPKQGWPVAFFPYKKQEGYLPPLVFAKFTNVPKGTSIKIECRAYAKNINFDRTEKQGGVEFELVVE